VECRGEIGIGVIENITKTGEDKGVYKRKTIRSSGKLGRQQPRTIPTIMTATNLIPIRRPSTRNTMPAQQVSSKIISPLDPTISNIQAPSSWAIHTDIEVLRLVVSVEGLLGLERVGPGAIGCQAGELTWSAGMRATGGEVKYRLVWRLVRVE